VRHESEDIPLLRGELDGDEGIDHTGRLFSKLGIELYRSVRRPGGSFSAITLFQTCSHLRVRGVQYITRSV
jgi:hypothetical protein